MQEPGVSRPPMTVTAEPRAGQVRLTAVGEIDMSTAGDLRAALDAALNTGTVRIVVDLAAVTFLDSTALGVIVYAHNRADDSCRVVLINPHPFARRILETTGLLALLTED